MSPASEDIFFCMRMPFNRWGCRLPRHRHKRYEFVCAADDRVSSFCEFGAFSWFPRLGVSQFIAQSLQRQYRRRIIHQPDVKVITQPLDVDLGFFSFERESICEGRQTMNVCWWKAPKIIPTSDSIRPCHGTSQKRTSTVPQSRRDPPRRQPASPARKTHHQSATPQVTVPSPDQDDRKPELTQTKLRCPHCSPWEQYCTEQS